MPIYKPVQTSGSLKKSLKRSSASNNEEEVALSSTNNYLPKSQLFYNFIGSPAVKNYKEAFESKSYYESFLVLNRLILECKKNLFIFSLDPNDNFLSNDVIIYHLNQKIREGLEIELVFISKTSLSSKNKNGLNLNNIKIRYLHKEVADRLLRVELKGLFFLSDDKHVFNCVNYQLGAGITTFNNSKHVSRFINLKNKLKSDLNSRK